MAIGVPIPRVDGPSKLTGQARYVDDLVLPGMLHGGTVRTTIARGRISGVHFDPAIPWHEFIIVDHRDVPVNEVAFIEHEQPVLASDVVHHAQEPVVLLAHADPAMLRRGLRGVTIEYAPLPAVLDPLLPLTPEQIQYGTDNIFKKIDIRKGAGEGDLAPVFAAAPHVFEGTYRTGAQEHVYLETQGMLASTEQLPGGQTRLMVQGTMQCPYYVLKSLTHALARPAEAFRVVQTTTGGGFGGKEDYPSIIALHACLLCEKAGRSVKIIYDRHEDMAVTTKRHPSWVRHRTAVDGAGHLLAMEIEVVFDSGAFMTLSPVVLSRGVIHAAGPYFCEHIHIHGEARLTNKPANGAFRGFGAPQTLFAIERHLDVIAAKLGLDPTELRRRNLLHDGQTTATGQTKADGVDLIKLMEKGMAALDWDARKGLHRHFNRQHPWLRRGLGLATFLHGAGFTGSGESYLASQAWVEGLPDGRVRVLTANTDIGQGTETVFAQIAGDACAMAFEEVEVLRPDTTMVPNSGPTVASRTVMIVGKLVEVACADLLRQLDAAGVSAEPPNGATPPASECARRIRAWHAAHPGERLLGRAQYEKPASVEWDDVRYRGSAYATFAWACYLAEVEVDLRTAGVRVMDFVALQEVGKVIHPTLARGQIQGGVVQGIGWALMEEIVEHEGAMHNAQLTNYIIPTSGDLPPIRVLFDEQHAEFGPQGAKGIGELPMDGPAPALLNAVADALGGGVVKGLALSEIPLTPERLMPQLEAVV